MMSSTAEHWARVRLQQGHSGAAHWELASNVPEARLNMGSSPQAQWRVEGPGIEPLHLELAWDGSCLWVIGLHDADVSVDGVPIMGWTQLVGQSTVQFGSGVLAVETSAQGAAPPPVEAVEDMSQDWEQDSPTHLFDEDVRDGVLAAPQAGLAVPRVGGGAEVVEAFGALEADSTRIVDEASLRPTASPEEIEEMLLEAELEPEPEPEPEPKPVKRTPAPGTMLPTAKFTPPPPEMIKKKGFQLPSKRVMGLLGLVVVALIGLAVIEHFRDQRRNAALRAAHEQSQAQQREDAEAVAATVRERIQARVVARDNHEREVRERLAEARETAMATAREAATEANAREDEEVLRRAVASAERGAAERLAIDALATNNYEDALGHVQWLVESYEDNAFREMIPILRAKLRCRGGRLADGSTCE